MIAASALASFFDPVAFLIFAGLGAVALLAPDAFAVTKRAGRMIIFVVCIAGAIGASFAVVELRERLQLAPGTSFTPDPSHNPIDLIDNTKYLFRHWQSFVGSRSEAETRSIMAKIDQRERDCRTLVGAWTPAYMLISECTMHSRLATLLAGSVQFVVGIVGIVLWRRRQTR